MVQEKNIQVLSALFLNEDFRKAMDKDIDKAIFDMGFQADQEFVKKLKDYKLTQKFVDLESSSVRDVHSSLETTVGLESRW